MAAPRVALAHDYLTQRGGAERVVVAMARAFHGSEIYTSLYNPEATYPELADLVVHESALVHVPMLRTRHRLGLAAYAWAFGRMQPSADVVICSTSGWAHGIGGDAPRIVYCHTPARWLYRRDDFRPSLATRGVMSALGPPLRRWDQSHARSAVRYLTNAPNIAERIADVYGIDAEVLPPPLTLDPGDRRQPIPGVGSGFVLCVARLMPYKHVDLLCAAAALMPDIEVVVVGDGPERDRLHAAAPINVRFVKAVDDTELRWLYASAGVLAAPAEEDYGLTPVEAAAFGVPTVARAEGGHLVTVIDGKTGVLVPSPTAGSLAEALRGALAARWDRDLLRAHAAKRSEAAFARRLRSIVDEVI